MNDFSKSDGSKIAIRFSERLRNPFKNQQDYFTVTVPEYKFVPDGPIIDIIKNVKDTNIQNSFSIDLIKNSEVILDDAIIDREGYLSISNGSSETIDVIGDNIDTFFEITKNSNNYGFTWNGNEFYSSNKGIRSSTSEWTLTAKRRMSVEFTYGYGSERNYDKATVKVKDDFLLKDASGTNREASINGILLDIGESIYFKYTKDGSGNDNMDKLYFKNMKISTLSACSSSASAEFILRNISLDCSYEEIVWEQSMQENMNVDAYYKINDAPYKKIQNGVPMQIDKELTNATFRFKFVLERPETSLLSPFVSNIIAKISSVEDSKILILNMVPTERFPGAVGNIIVSYAGGDLCNKGGKVDDFSVSFFPEDLKWKGHVNDPTNNIDINAEMTNVNLKKIVYNFFKSKDENIDVDASITKVDLKNIHDI